MEYCLYVFPAGEEVLISFKDLIMKDVKRILMKVNSVGNENAKCTL